MRSRLLRVMAHLKAASLHIQAAHDILTHWRYGVPGSEGVNLLRKALADDQMRVRAYYGAAVEAVVKPARLP